MRKLVITLVIEIDVRLDSMFIDEQIEERVCRGVKNISDALWPHAKIMDTEIIHRSK